MTIRMDKDDQLRHADVVVVLKNKNPYPRSTRRASTGESMFRIEG